MADIRPRLAWLRAETIAEMLATTKAGMQTRNSTDPIAMPSNADFDPGRAKIIAYAATPTTMATALAATEIVALVERRSSEAPEDR